MAISVTPSKRDAVRVPFGNLIERGLINPGTILMSENGRHTAQVRADGSLATDSFQGSIHQVGAHVQSAQACNGWTFWQAISPCRCAVLARALILSLWV